MTVSMFNECVDEIAKEYHKNEANFRTQLSILTILGNMYNGPLKKDKFCKAKVKEVVTKLNPAFAEGYFKNERKRV